MNPNHLLEILTSVVLLPPQDDGFGVFFLNYVIPTEKPLGFDEESTVDTSQSR